MRVHSQRPLLQIFIFAMTKLLTNEPHQKAMIEAPAMRGVWPKMRATAACSSAPSAVAGSATITLAITEAKPRAAKPAQTTRRSRA